MLKLTGAITLIFACFLFGVAKIALGAPTADDDEMVTEWTITVSENDVQRVINPFDPSDIKVDVYVDQQLAPGWRCEVLPEIWRGNIRYRWLTCQNGGRAKVSVRTSCRSNRSSSWEQQLWLGDKISIDLACRSGISP